jgi:hypothetical protein
MAIPLAMPAEAKTHLGSQGKCRGCARVIEHLQQLGWSWSIPMITAQCRKDHGAHFVAPISNKAGHLIGGFVHG